MREKVLYLFYSRSCSLVEKAALFVFTFCLLRARVCAQDADKIHSLLLLLLLLLGTYLPARARKQSSSGRRSIECGVKEKTASCAGAEEASRARRRCRMNRTGFRTKTTGRRKKEEEEERTTKTMTTIDFLRGIYIARRNVERI